MIIEVTGVLHDGTPLRTGVPSDTRTTLEINKGADVELRIRVVKPDGTPVSLVTADSDEVLFTMKKRPTETPKVGRAAVLNGTNIAVVTLVPTDTRRISAGLYSWDVWLTKEDKRNAIIPLSPLKLLDSNAAIPFVTPPPPVIPPPAGGTGGSGWIYIEDIQPIALSPVPTYQDPPADTVLQTATVTDTAMSVTVRASYPLVEINTIAGTLDRDPSGGFYSGSVNINLPGGGEITAQLMTPEDTDGAVDTAQVTISLPAAITAAVFTGGKPGGQTSLKEDDTVQLQVTADKDFDQVVLLDEAGHANKAATIGVATGVTATVAVTAADRGTSPLALGARLQVRDAVSGALSAVFNTESAGAVEDVNVVTVNNFFPTLSLGAPGSYPGAQQALKASETAVVPVTTSGADTIDWVSTPGHLTITNPNETGPGFDASKAVQRIGGTYNVAGDGGVVNIQGTATFASNGATTVDTAIVNIADDDQVVTVAEDTPRVRSGPAPGNDTLITISSTQELLSAPSLDPTASRGTFQGGGFAGGPKVWTRSLRVPDSENPTDGSAHNWLNLSSTNLAGKPVTVITGNATYVIGGFTARTLTYPPGTANSTETIPVTTEAKLAVGRFSDGNDGVVKPFGTPDTSGTPNFGWWAPNAASGNTTGRMLNTDQVAANAAGLTLPDVEETA